MIRTPTTGTSRTELSLVILANLVLLANGKLKLKPSRKRPGIPVPASKLKNLRKLMPPGRTTRIHSILSSVPEMAAARKMPLRPDRILSTKMALLLDQEINLMLVATPTSEQ